MSLLGSIGFILTLIGGLILLFLGIGAAFGIFLLIFYPLYSLTAFLWGVVMIIIGLVVAGGSRFVTNSGTAILMILLGLVASLLGAWYIGWLIIIGGICGLLARD